jgi:thioesterase domain-containing protein
MRPVLPNDRLDDAYRIFERNHRLLAAHRMSPWAGRALVLQSTAGSRTDGPTVWEQVLRGNSRYLGVPTDHYGLLRQPHVVQVAREIAQFIATS